MLRGMLVYAGFTYKNTGSTSGNLKAWGQQFWKLIPKLVKHYRIGMGALASTSFKNDKLGRSIAGVGAENPSGVNKPETPPEQVGQE